ncbi:hypothetical protein Tco_0425387 [Tanacetum coccineum]
MADNRRLRQQCSKATLRRVLRDAIDNSEITVQYLEISIVFLNLVQNNQFFGHDKEDTTLLDIRLGSVHDLLRGCPHHGFQNCAINSDSIL